MLWSPARRRDMDERLNQRSEATEYESGHSGFPERRAVVSEFDFTTPEPRVPGTHSLQRTQG